MARFMVSMPDGILKKLDRRARQEHRTRSELLREAVRRHLGTAVPETPKVTKTGKRQRRGRWTRKTLEEYLMSEDLARKGCPGVDSLLGPLTGPVDMKRVLRLSKKIPGLSRQIIDEREVRS
jgi:hypothetical protein